MEGRGVLTMEKSSCKWAPCYPDFSYLCSQLLFFQWENLELPLDPFYNKTCGVILQFLPLRTRLCLFPAWHQPRCLPKRLNARTSLHTHLKALPSHCNKHSALHYQFPHQLGYLINLHNLLRIHSLQEFSLSWQTQSCNLCFSLFSPRITWAPGHWRSRKPWSQRWKPLGSRSKARSQSGCRLWKTQFVAWQSGTFTNRVEDGENLSVGTIFVEGSPWHNPQLQSLGDIYSYPN